MGADLYIQPLREPNYQKYHPLFEKAVVKRNAETDEAKKAELQKEVEKYYEKMDEIGYFRDSYNSTSLFWQFDLSWWNNDFINKEGNITPEKAKELLIVMKHREEKFRENLAKIPTTDQTSNAEWQEYFEKKYKRFQEFLQLAIDNNMPIECSV